MAIAIVGMLDEREEALALIKAQIEEKAFRVCLIDVSIGAGAIAPRLRPDVSAAEVAELGRTSGADAGPGSTLQTIAALMGIGLKRKVSALYESGDLEGIIGIAGLTGTLITLQAMQALPFGLPKLLLSSAAAMPAHAGRLADFFALKDVTVMHTVVDTVGMNHLVKALAINGANAIAGMAKAYNPSAGAEKPMLALTEFGFCDKGAHYVREALKSEYEVVSLLATGLGDRALLDLTKQGYFRAFIDLVPCSFSEYLLGGNRASGPDRLDVARDQPIPYVFCPGGFDMISCGPLERRDAGDPLWVSRKLSQRKLNVKDSLRAEARTSADEMKGLGAAVAEKLNRYPHKERVKVVIPGKGFSSLSVEGADLFDPAADSAFTEALKGALDPSIALAEVDADINDPAFARAIAAVLREIPGREIIRQRQR